MSSSAKQSFEGDAIATVSKSYPVTDTAATRSGEASKTASVHDDAKSRNTKSPFEVPVGEAGVGAVSRKLSSRHIQMIGIGGGIGTGLFVGSGIALANAGPVGVLLAYIITGMTIFGVMEGLAEMSSYLPVSGTFMHFASRFVDPSLGMALGWNYWWCYAIGWASELSAASAVIGYWNADINIAAWISIMMVVGAVLNFAGVNIYGESEVVTSTIKLLAFVMLIIFGLVIDLGGGPKHDRLGFRYWKDPGAFNQFNGIAGSEGRFLGFFSAFLQSAFTYVGTETVVLAAGEAKNPSTQIPKAARRVLYRILFFYILGIAIMGLIVPYNDPGLKSDGSYTGASPWIVAMTNAGVTLLPHIFNAVVLVSAFSAGSSYVYVASRTLYALALDRQAPAVFRRVDKRGIPYVAVLGSWVIGALAYLGISSGGGTVFSWLSALSAVAGLFAWATCCYAYLRFRRAYVMQGYDDSVLPYRARLQPYASWFSIGVCAIVIVFSGWSVFLNGNFTASGFLTNYLGIPVFFVPWLGWKLWHKTKVVKLAEVDLDSGRLRKEDEAPETVPTGAWAKFIAWLF
ncbi:probable general amino acid permease [Sporisorium reilianum f. sp. reilianum]|uniref:Probable general amino acid permease n=1 Tax=Sporisorium reilianum f. sp. reilianum TaxID=72559 RepID=A0A2N8UF24_9BASI|nr:probable general amino acid permease [Sporisorium reilianum f. sp. reilianum]